MYFFDFIRLFFTVFIFINFKKSTFIQTFLSKPSPIQFKIFHLLNELS